MAKKDLFKIEFLEDISKIFYDKRFSGFLKSAVNCSNVNEFQFLGFEFLKKRKGRLTYLHLKTSVIVTKLENKTESDFIFKIPLNSVNAAKDLSGGVCYFKLPGKKGGNWNSVSGHYSDSNSTLYVEKQAIYV